MKTYKTYQVEFYPLVMIERANSKRAAEEAARYDIEIGEYQLELKSVKEIEAEEA